MLEYIFFHQQPFDAFVAFLQAEGLEPQTICEDGSYEIRLPEDIDDALSERIETRYDELMDVNQELFEAELESGASNYHGAGVVVNLSDGQAVYAQVDPALLSKVMQVISPEELGQIVSAIVDAVESPDTRTFCQRMRDDEL